MAQIGACEAAIVALWNAAPGLRTGFGNVGAVKALTDPDARQGLGALTERELLGKSTDTSATVERDASGRPKVRMRHYSNWTTASVTTPTCSGTAATPTETTFVLTKYIQQSLTVSLDRMKSLCGDAAAVYNGGKGIRFQAPNTSVMNEIVYMMLPIARKLVQDLDADLVATLKTSFGNNARTGAATVQDLTLYNADGTKTSAGIDQLLMDYQINEGIGTPIILGGDKIVKYMRSLDYACCSDEGVDYGAIRSKVPFRIYYDPRVDNATTGFAASGQFAVINAGAHKLVTASRYFLQGQNPGRIANSTYGRVTFDELPGLVFDLVVDESGCVGPGYLFILSLSYEVFVPPSPWGSGDPLNGVNGMFRYNAATAA